MFIHLLVVTFAAVPAAMIFNQHYITTYPWIHRTPSQPLVTARPAVPIFADRISLPSEAGRVDMLQHLPPQWASHYSDEAKCLRPQHEFEQFAGQPKLSKPKFMGIRSEYLI